VRKVRLSDLRTDERMRVRGRTGVFVYVCVYVCLCVCVCIYVCVCLKGYGVMFEEGRRKDLRRMYL